MKDFSVDLVLLLAEMAFHFGTQIEGNKNEALSKHQKGLLDC